MNQFQLGNIGKIDNGIVSVNVYGIYQNITFPLMTKIYKPESKLKVEDKYQTKTEIAGEMVKELKKLGFKIKLVLADSLYGESSIFLNCIINSVKSLCLSYSSLIRLNYKKGSTT